MIVVGSTPPSLKPEDVALAAALTRFLPTKNAPDYLRSAGAAWLAAHSTTKGTT